MCEYPLVFGPTNEQGVIYLFGSLAVDMGFIVTQLRRIIGTVRPFIFMASVWLGTRPPAQDRASPARRDSY